MENHTNKTYQERMNKTALSKFGAIEHLLDKDVKLLDFGSGFSPEFIEQVKQTGALYFAYDISPIVQEQLRENNIAFLPKHTLENVENEFDVIYLSSVFHELMSYLSRPERTKTFAMLDKALKPNGTLIIRDWGPGDVSSRPQTIEVASEAVDDVSTWVKALIKQSVINEPYIYKAKPCRYKHAQKQLYEIIFHTVWGLGSLERESKESYAIDSHLINKWICAPHGYKITQTYEEFDESYLPYVQKYFKLDSIPWPTKIIYQLKKNEG